MSSFNEINKLWLENKNRIQERLDGFKNIWNQSDNNKIFKELTFCLFTPQSKAISCWDAVENLDKKGLLYSCSHKNICTELNSVRFKNNKTRYLILAQKQISSLNNKNIKEHIKSFGNPNNAREWLVSNVKGMGYKEASHFLRNIGFSNNLAILDRHILKNLKHFKVINKIPKNLNKKEYLKIENKMLDYCNKSKIPLNHLDLLLWFKETGKIFK